MRPSSARPWLLIALFGAAAACTGDDGGGGGSAGAGGGPAFQLPGGSTGGAPVASGGGAPAASGGAPGSGGVVAGGAPGGGGAVGGMGPVGTQPLGALCAIDSHCNQSQGVAVCCVDTCKLKADCQPPTTYLPCKQASDCSAYGGGKVCCDAGVMRFCTKPSACGGRTLP